MSFSVANANYKVNLMVKRNQLIFHLYCHLCWIPFTEKKPDMPQQVTVKTSLPWLFLCKMMFWGLEVFCLETCKKVLLNQINKQKCTKTSRQQVFQEILTEFKSPVVSLRRTKSKTLSTEVSTHFQRKVNTPSVQKTNKKKITNTMEKYFVTDAYYTKWIPLQ